MVVVCRHWLAGVSFHGHAGCGYEQALRWGRGLGHFVAAGGSAFPASCLEGTRLARGVPVQSTGGGSGAPALPGPGGQGPRRSLRSRLAGRRRRPGRTVKRVPGAAPCSGTSCFKQGVLPFLLSKSEMSRAREYPVLGENLWAFSCVLAFYEFHHFSAKHF